MLRNSKFLLSTEISLVLFRNIVSIISASHILWNPLLICHQIFIVMVKTKKNISGDVDPPKIRGRVTGAKT